MVHRLPKFEKTEFFFESHQLYVSRVTSFQNRHEYIRYIGKEMSGISPIREKTCLQVSLGILKILNQLHIFPLSKSNPHFTNLKVDLA